MGNPKPNAINAVVPLVEPGISEVDEQPRDFHFAVTWVTLFAHLDLVPARGPWRRAETVSPTLALVPVSAAPLMIEPPAYRDSNAAVGTAAWEMVVPKMIRTGSGEFTPIQGNEESS